MQPVVIYTLAHCPYCVRAKQLLSHKQASFQEIPVDGDPQLRAQMTERAGRTSVPQIWIGTTHVGGCDDLYALEHQGKLDELLHNGL